MAEVAGIVIVAVFGVVVMIDDCCGSNWDDAIDATASDVADDADAAALLPRVPSSMILA